MTAVTVQVPDELAQRVQSLGPWLSAILELGLVGFKTLATATASEVVEFLSSNPSPEQVLAFHPSEKSQNRLRRLLALNEAAMLSELEHRELDELQRLEHIVVMLKAQVARQIQHQP